MQSRWKVHEQDMRSDAKNMRSTCKVQANPMQNLMQNACKVHAKYMQSAWKIEAAWVQKKAK